MTSVSILVAALLLAAGQQPSAAQWARADVNTIRARPDRFPSVPTAIRAELEHRGCLIPQPYTATPDRPENAVRGRFSSANATDWAILCSRQGRSSILVFRGGDAARIDELAPEADKSKLQQIGSGQIGYSRSIGVANPDEIRRHRQRSKLPLTPPDHDGIDDAFLGKASVVWYWSDGKWLQLSGADTTTLSPGGRS